MIKTLRSEKYRQARGFLVRKTKHRKKFCCLGVAHIVAGSKVIQTEQGLGFIDIEGRKSLEFLTHYVKEFFGFASLMGEFEKYEGGNSLINYNDVQKYSFKQIADVIEEKGT